MHVDANRDVVVLPFFVPVTILLIYFFLICSSRWSLENFANIFLVTCSTKFSVNPLFLVNPYKRKCQKTYNLLEHKFPTWSEFC